MKKRPEKKGKKPSREKGRSSEAESGQKVDAAGDAARMSRLKPSGDSTRTASARCALESCGREFRYDPADISRNPSFPFCSTRCKGADLGGWVTEEYRIEEPADPDRLPGPLEAGNEREHEKTGSDQDDADE